MLSDSLDEFFSSCSENSGNESPNNLIQRLEEEKLGFVRDPKLGEYENQLGYEPNDIGTDSDHPFPELAAQANLLNKQSGAPLRSILKKRFEDEESIDLDEEEKEFQNHKIVSSKDIHKLELPHLSSLDMKASVSCSLSLQPDE